MNKTEALNRLTALENEAAELRKIIEAPEAAVKPTKEERFWELINNLTWKIDKEKYPYSIFGFNGENWQVEFDSEKGYLWLRYSTFWKVFEDEYRLAYAEIQSFIKIAVEEHFKCKGVTPLIR